MTTSRPFIRLLGCLLLAVLAGCGPSGRSFRIRGEISGMQSGELYVFSPTAELAQFDTLQVKEGRFLYTGQVSRPTALLLLFPNAVEQVIFVDGGQSLRYRAKTNDLGNYVVEGSKENELMNSFREEAKHLDHDHTLQLARKYIRNHPKSLAAVYLFDRYFLQDAQVDSKTVSDILRPLRAAQPDNRTLLAAAGRLKVMGRGHVDSLLPALTLTTKQEQKVNLRKLNHDCTLLAFWASWMPQQWNFISSLRSLQREYGKQAGFVAVSLDTQIYQWENFIRPDSTSISHVCDGRAWDSPVVNALGIRQVPTYFIAGHDGRILARGNNTDDMRRDFERFVK